MDRRKLMVVGVVAGSLGLGSIIGAVVFTPGVGLAGSSTMAPEAGFAFCAGGSGLIEAAAAAIGIEPSELADALRNGQTIAEVARANDVEVASLVDAIVASERERLDQAVEDGRLTQDQADEIAADLEDRVTDLVNGELAPFPILGAPALGLWPGPIGVAAEAIGIEPEELLTALGDGQTIAEVARANDVEVASVVDAIVAAMKERLDQAVENGWLTQEQADARAADLEERVTDLVNGELPALGGPSRPGGLPRWPGGTLLPPLPADGGGSEVAADLSLL